LRILESITWQASGKTVDVSHEALASTEQPIEHSSVDQGAACSSPESVRRPRKVLHVLNSAAGGAALSTLGLIAMLRRCGIAACAVCHDAGSGAEREQLRRATGGEVLFLPLYWWNRKIRAARWKRPLLELRQILRTGWARRSAAQVAEFARSRGADLIHTNTFLVPEGGIAARRLGLPHVWHIRELLGPGQPFQLAMRREALMRYLKRHASLIVANSQTSANSASGLIPADMLRVVPNGIDLKAFSGLKTRPTTGRSLVVGMVASLTSRTKNHVLFVEAASRLKRVSGVEFRIYGHDSAADGVRSADPYSHQIHERVLQLGLTDRFHFPGYIADPARIMAEIDILVHPADNESFGRVIVEAMAAGLPVVGVRGGGVAEIVIDGETGLLSPPDEADALAANIERVVHDESLRARLGAAGRLRAEACYSLESCAAGILRVYEEAMRVPVGKPAEAPRP
jgi:glycosyltransferase involved in cell wall biosynthesis